MNGCQNHPTATPSSWGQGSLLAQPHVSPNAPGYVSLPFPLLLLKRLRPLNGVQNESIELNHVSFLGGHALCALCLRAAIGTLSVWRDAKQLWPWPGKQRPTDNSGWTFFDLMKAYRNYTSVAPTRLVNAKVFYGLVQSQSMIRPDSGHDAN